MLFTSLQFIVFFALVLALNQTLRRWPLLQKLMLLFASYYFYAQWNWHYLFLVWFSTVVDYSIGRRLPHSPNSKRLIILSVIVNLGFLAIFKYANWFIASVNGSAAALGSSLHITPLDVLLPVGISFYTFQSLSYTIDVYRGVMPPRKNFLDYALAVAFFPQLEAGPIVRAREFFAELDGPKLVRLADAQRALVLIGFGFVKKMVFADSLAPISDAVFDNPIGAGFWNTLLAIYAFAFQIYCDFSGYTDIAIGCALLLGIRFPQNFNYPYAAQSIQDFWRRWHMTLSRWKFWHAQTRAMAAVRWLVTFHLVCFAWIFFRARSLEAARHMIGNLLHGAMGALHDYSQDRHLGLVLLLALMMATHLVNSYGDTKERLGRDLGPRFATAMTVVLLLLILFTPNHSAPFIYFQF